MIEEGVVYGDRRGGVASEDELIAKLMVLKCVGGERESGGGRKVEGEVDQGGGEGVVEIRVGGV